MSLRDISCKQRIKMFRFIKKMFLVGSTILSTLIGVNSLSATPFSCISMTNRECKVRPQTVRVNNETRHIKWHETCKCNCRLDASVCNNKQRWNDDKCRCECKELIDKVCVINDLFGILVIVSVNAINHVMLENIYIMKIVSARKD